jgi:hypothetical protein
VGHAAPEEDLDDRFGLGFGRGLGGLRIGQGAAVQAVGEQDARSAEKAVP